MISWDVGDVASGGSTTLIFSVTTNVGTAGTEICNTASVTGSEDDPYPDNDAATVCIDTYTGCSPGVEFIVDDGDLTGSWQLRSGADNYEIDMNRNNDGDGNATATFTPNITEAGSYKVYLWWHGNWNRSDTVPVTITHAGMDSPTQVTVNQENDDGENWSYELGTYDFEVGTSGSVQITNIGTGSGSGINFVIADAVKFACTTEPPVDTSLPLVCYDAGFPEIAGYYSDAQWNYQVIIPLDNPPYFDEGIQRSLLIGYNRPRRC